jgi:hypothetical protein
MKQITLLLFLAGAGLQIHAQMDAGLVSQMNNFHEDSLVLSRLNTQFIQNFINNDTVAHNQVVYKDFLCIGSNGQVIERNEYMRGWAHGYDSHIYSSFIKEKESIRLFGDMALVRSETIATINDRGNKIQKRGLYTDTYVRVNGRWWCVQAQLTPVK